jgi:Spy/CpxP family protein refolding chaperone
MISWKTLLAGFLIGLLAGGGWGAWYASERREGWKRPEIRSQRALARFTKKLDLTAEQRRDVAEVLRAKRERIESVRGEAKPRMEEIRENARREIRALLAPEQQKKFDAMEEERERRRPEAEQKTW